MSTRWNLCVSRSNPNIYETCVVSLYREISGTSFDFDIKEHKFGEQDVSDVANVDRLPYEYVKQTTEILNNIFWHHTRLPQYVKRRGPQFTCARGLEFF